MADETPAETVNAATLELLERRLSDQIIATVRPRLFRFYAATGAVVIAVLGALEFNLYREIKDAASEYARSQTETAVKDAQDAEGKVNQEFKVLDTLILRAQTTFDRLDQRLTEFAPKAQRLNDIESQMDDLSGRLREAAAASGDAGQNGDRLRQLSDQVALLARQVDELSAYAKAAPVASAAPAAGAVAPQPASVVSGRNASGEETRPSSATPAAPTAAAPGNAAGSDAPAAIGQAAQAIATTSSGLAQQIDEDQQRQTVFLQFYGIPRDKAEALATTLRQSYRVPGIELTPAANTGKFEVRYFYAAEAPAARALADAAGEAAKSVLGDGRPVGVVPLLDFAGRKPKRGVLELWYSPSN